MQSVFVAIWIMVVLAYGVVQVYAAWLGLDDAIGGWAFVVLILAFMLRFTLVITIASFFGALYVWEWHWFWALLFAAPGLVVAVPGVLAMMIELGKNLLSRKT